MGPSKADLLPIAGLTRRCLARLIDLALQFVALLIPLAMIDGSRPLAHVFVGMVGVAAYEAVFLTWTGATPGKLVCGLRVAELGLTGPVSPPNAVRRGLVIGVALPVGVLGAGDGVAVALVLAALVLVPSGLVILASAVLSPLRRGFHDRAFATVVVKKAAPSYITVVDLAGWADIDIVPQATPYGSAASLDQRRRARTGRLDDAPLLVVVLVGCAIAGTVFSDVGWWVLAAMWTAWLVAFVIDETWRIARFGATAGHRPAGLAVVDLATGEPPSPWRSLARAVVLGLVLYTLVLLPALALWVRLARHRRGPHDRVGRTVVVVASPAMAEVERATAA